MKHFYDQTVILLDRDTSTGGYFSTSTGADYSTDVSILGALNLTRGSERFYGDGFTVRAEYKLYCDPTTEVVYGRRCRVLGSTYEIVEDPKDVLQMGHHYEVLLKEVDGV